MSNSISPAYDTTLMVRDACLCLHLQRAARSVARLFDDALRPLDLTNGQFSILMALNRPEPPAMGAVAALLALDRTTLTANLKPLARRGLVTATADPEDRRLKRISLTAEGEALLSSALPIWSATQRKVEGLIGDADTVRQELRALS